MLELARRAGEAERRLEAPDIESILSRATDGPHRPHWVIRASAAAAALVAALGALQLARSPEPQVGPVPVHITALVESLYPDQDYIEDELLDMLAGPVGQDPYMEDVWSSVITDMES